MRNFLRSTLTFKVVVLATIALLLVLVGMFQGNLIKHLGVRKVYRPTVQDSHKGVTIFNETGEDLKCECVPFNVDKPVITVPPVICIYGDIDGVSGYLRRSGKWEPHILTPLGKHLRAHPGSVFLDVGSHVGTYTLYANALGHRAIAIDPLRSNLQRLSKSLHLLHQQDSVTLLWNAVSNVREKIILRYRKGNIGTTHTREDGIGYYNMSASNYTVQTILLDDLIDEFQLENRSIIMKIDIEGSEHRALMGGANFFRRANVCFVSMEFVFHKGSWRLEMIFDTMRGFGFEIFADPSLTQRLTNSSQLKGFDVYFAKKC